MSIPSDPSLSLLHKSNAAGSLNLNKIQTAAIELPLFLVATSAALLAEEMRRLCKPLKDCNQVELPQIHWRRAASYII